MFSMGLSLLYTFYTGRGRSVGELGLARSWYVASLVSICSWEIRSSVGCQGLHMERHRSVYMQLFYS